MIPKPGKRWDFEGAVTARDERKDVAPMGLLEAVIVNPWLPPWVVMFDNPPDIRILGSHAQSPPSPNGAA